MSVEHSKARKGKNRFKVTIPITEKKKLFILQFRRRMKYLELILN